MVQRQKWNQMSRANEAESADIASKILAQLPRCISALMRWRSHLPDLGSWEESSSRLPRTRRNSRADSPGCPSVSMARGTNSNVDLSSSVYLSRLRRSASVETPLGERAAIVVQLGARGFGHVKSQTRRRPEFHGTSDIPSGRLPSLLHKPDGSRRAG